MKKVLFFGACVIGGMTAAKVLRKCLNKATEKLNEEEAKEVKNTVDKIVTVACVAGGVKCAYDIVTLLDEKIRAVFLLSLINSVHIGTVDREDAKKVVELGYSQLRKNAKLAVEPFIKITFPELLGGE